MIERMVRSATGAGAGLGGGAGAVVCAKAGTAEVARIVPTRSSAPTRLKLFALEITRPRLLCNGAAASGRHAPVRPAPTLLANQALKPVPEPERAQIVDRCENEQGENDRKPATEGPIERLGTEWAAPDCFDDVEK